ncbi:hypothetical protein [Streptomyces sp. NTK 937]|uniref:hypothetical protein n=1 Tax=Streptomyces sp. NTK 937 TaxID=1487711 RepID=UPI0004A92156|nr:hypothetical protein [Streptomyces sp. NTK 937]KDQ65745.1 hypothetical protein DT87_00370 [Streptomyces sp. NTK 937]
MRTLSELLTAFSSERTRYRDSEVRATIDRLESAAEAAMYKENEIGGQARRVVGDVAVALGVVLGDTGPRMSVWDPANMRRVVAAAKALREERDGYRAAYESKPASMRLEGPGAEMLAARLDDVNELRATIVSQAREIARLKGESA